jgi:hypothetical protein
MSVIISSFKIGRYQMTFKLYQIWRNQIYKINNMPATIFNLKSFRVALRR